MTQRIVIIQGHPDPSGGHYDHALAAAYREGAEEAGHTVEEIAVARLDFPLLRTKVDFDGGEPPPAIRKAQETIRTADHLLILYPLWLGGMPALLQAFFEQVLRPGFAFQRPERGLAYRKLLKGKSARVVVTMGMPGWAYRWLFGAHSLKSLERNILGFVGIGPIRSSLIGSIEAGDDTNRRRWLRRMRAYGRAAS